MSQPDAPSTEQLNAELSKMLLLELHREWELINWTFFQSKLRSPVLRLSSSAKYWGRWNATLRQIEISTSMILEQSWSFVYEVLKHEVVHQYVDEVLKVKETPHGPTFRKICRDIGLDPAASGNGEPQEHRSNDPKLEKLLERMRKLLALAQSSNRFEAENAAASAQRMMLKYNLQLTEDETPNIHLRAIQLGTPIRRIYEHQSWVGSILTDHFFVRAIWMPVYLPLMGKSAQILEICGNSANLSLAEYVHDFLHESATRLWKAHQQSHGIRANRDRLTFFAGVMRGFYDRLNQQYTDLEQEHGLVLNKDRHLDDYFSRRFPKSRSFSGSSRSRKAAYQDGQKAGKSIILSKPIETTNHSTHRKMLRA